MFKAIKMPDPSNKKVKALVIILELFLLALIVYILFLPIYPIIKYNYLNDQFIEQGKDLNQVIIKTVEIVEHLPASASQVSGNRLIITKIGVNALIVESDDENYALSRGAWLMPDTAKPGETGNAVITGHRFKYLPPSNLTFYLFDRLSSGDIVSIFWQDEYYYYKIRETKIVDKTDVAILKETDEPILTLFTCDPIYSQKNRLVVIAELIN